MLFWAASLPVISSLRPEHGIKLAVTVEPRSHARVAGTAECRRQAGRARSHVVARPWGAPPSGARQVGPWALGSLAETDERLSSVVECRFFAGYTEEETAEILGMTARTVRRDWSKARAFLYHALRDRTEP